MSQEERARIVTPVLGKVSGLCSKNSGSPKRLFTWRLTLLDLTLKKNPLAVTWRLTGVGQWGCRETRGPLDWEVVLDWQEVVGRAQKASRRASDQPGCFSFRFLQQICERDIGQDGCRP